MYDLLESRAHSVNDGHTDMIRAVFCDEFDLGVDHDVVAEITRGDVDDWVNDLRATGLFLPGEVRAVQQLWRRDPSTLLAVLLQGIDEVSQRRVANLLPRTDVALQELSAV